MLLGEFIHQLQRSISSWKVSLAADFLQWVNQDDSQDFCGAIFLLMGKIREQRWVQNWALHLEGCALLLETLGHLFFLKIVELLPLTQKKKRHQAVSNAFESMRGLFIGETKQNRTQKVITNKSGLFWGCWSLFFIWTTKQGLGCVKWDRGSNAAPKSGCWIILS